MKYIHNIKVTIFCKPEEDEEKIKNALLTLFPFNLSDEKIKIKTESVDIIENRRIKIFEVLLDKQRHVSSFLENLFKTLGKEQMTALKNQIPSRVDNNCDFFIRLDKEKLFEKEFILTESGACYHIKSAIAAFPAKKENAIKTIETLLNLLK